MTPTQREAAERLSNERMRVGGQLWGAEVVALLRELLAEPQSEPVAWHVCSVNSDGALSLEFAAPWEELAHEHINDAINEHDIDGAASWVVRPVYASPQPQQTEPAAWIQPDHLQKARVAPFLCRVEPTKRMSDFVPLYAHPPQQRKPLTDEQIDRLDTQAIHGGPDSQYAFRFARAIERAHGIVEAP